VVVVLGRTRDVLKVLVGGGDRSTKGEHHNAWEMNDKNGKKTTLW